MVVARGWKGRGSVSRGDEPWRVELALWPNKRGKKEPKSSSKLFLTEG